MAATTATVLMGVGTLFSVGATIHGANQQAKALNEQADFIRQQNEANQRLAEIQGEDAINRGDQAVGEMRRRADKIQGSQKAALAAQGIDISAGSAADTLAETSYFKQLDEITIKNNARREAWGYKVQAQNMATEARFKSAASNNMANNTLLTGGLSAIGTGLTSYANYRKT